MPGTASQSQAERIRCRRLQLEPGSPHVGACYAHRRMLEEERPARPRLLGALPLPKDAATPGVASHSVSVCCVSPRLSKGLSQSCGWNWIISLLEFLRSINR